MNAAQAVFALLRADFLERVRRVSFWFGVALVIYLGYAINAGQVLIKLGAYRGVYNSAWVGSLVAVSTSFLLGLGGFFLVKNTLERDEQTRVGQILATTSLTRAQYLLGKWLSNFTVLAALVGILAGAAVIMQVLQREAAQLDLWALLAPVLFITLPMMAFVSACAVFFESVRWLKGGFGNLVYLAAFCGGLLLPLRPAQIPWLDTMGLKLVADAMRAAAAAAFPTYDGTFTLAMIADQPLETFVWTGLAWTAPRIAQRLLWVALAAGLALLGAVFFNRFDPSRRGRVKSKPARAVDQPLAAQPTPAASRARLAPLGERGFYFNLLRLVWLEVILLVKGQKWYWLLGMAGIWLGCAAWPGAALRPYAYLLACLWPVLVWSQMGARDARCQTETLLAPTAHPLLRRLAPAWLAGVLVSAVLTSGVLVGRLAHGEPAQLLPWALSAVFIPTLALTLGAWSRGSRLFEAVYPILWYLGPFNPGTGLVGLDYLGIHPTAPIHTAPLLFAAVIAGFALLAAAQKLARSE